MNTNPTLNSDDGPVCEHGVATNYFVCSDCGNQPTDVIQVRFPANEVNETADERHIRLVNEARAANGLAPMTPAHAQRYLEEIAAARRVFS